MLLSAFMNNIMIFMNENQKIDHFIYRHSGGILKKHVTVCFNL